MSDWPPRFHMAEMTPAEAAKFLRQAAETTAVASKNWDNLEQILEQFLTDAYKGGVAAAAERARALAEAARVDTEREAYEAAAQICEHRASWSVLTTRLANAERKALLDAAENIRIAGAAAIRARGHANTPSSPGTDIAKA